MSTLAVLDTTYADVETERAAARPFSIDVDDRRSDGRGNDAAGILVQYATIDADWLDRHPGVRVVGRYGVGVDTIDVAAATERGVAVFNVPDYCVREVATHAAALILSATRRLQQADALVRAGRWNDWGTLRPMPDLSQLTLGLLGVGQIGAETARLAGPFFGRVIAFDPAGISSPGIELVDVDTLLSTADVLSLHCPLTPATHHIIDAEALARMQPTAHLVNVSRGGLVDADALAAALHAGALAGAALDVVEPEPPLPDAAILGAPDVLLTNHIAWLSEASEPRLRRLLAERCSSYLAGAPLMPPLNAAALADARTQREDRS